MLLPGHLYGYRIEGYLPRRYAVRWDVAALRMVVDHGGLQLQAGGHLNSGYESIR
jgi:hypothetical protein